MHRSVASKQGCKKNTFRVTKNNEMKLYAVCAPHFSQLSALLLSFSVGSTPKKSELRKRSKSRTQNGRILQFLGFFEPFASFDTSFTKSIEEIFPRIQLVQLVKAHKKFSRSGEVASNTKLFSVLNTELNVF